MGQSVFPAPSSGISVADGNAAGWGASTEKWTLLTRTTTSSTNPTFSGLSGYKKYRLVSGGVYAGSSAAYTPKIYLNGDSSGNKYSWQSYGAAAYNTYGWQGTFDGGDQQNWIQVSPLSLSSGVNWGNSFDIIIDNANSSGGKVVTSEVNAYSNGYPARYHLTVRGTYNTTSPLSSIALVCNNTNNVTPALSFDLSGTTSFLELWGAN